MVYKYHYFGFYGFDGGIKIEEVSSEDIVNDDNGRPRIQIVCGHGEYSYCYLFPPNTTDSELYRLSKLYSEENEVTKKQKEKEWKKQSRNQEIESAIGVIDSMTDEEKREHNIS